MVEKLGHQKDTIKNSLKKIDETRITLDEADGILNRMNRREKFLFYIIIFIVVVDVILFLSVVYVLLAKKLKLFK
jgi:type IV secretory pathway component VirB8